MEITVHPRFCVEFRAASASAAFLPSAKPTSSSARETAPATGLSGSGGGTCGSFCAGSFSVGAGGTLVFLSGKLSTPLQFETYLTRAFEEGYKVGQKPVTAEVIESILAKDINDLEPRLTRHGYNAKVLAEVLNAKPREIRALLRGQLAPGRAQELQHEMLAVGIPL